ncbi:142_t:CDS:2, partial [Racocetra fulgida]
CISNDSDNNQLGHLPLIRIELYCEKTFETWEEYQETLEHYAQGGDAANLLQYFEKEHAKNPDWYVQSWIDPETNRLQGVQPGKFMIDADLGLENNLTLEVVNNGPIEFEYDFQQIRFNELFERVDYSLIAEVWEVQSIEYKLYVGQNSEKAYFHISLIPKYAMINDEPFVRGKSLEDNSSTSSLPSFLDVVNSWSTMLIEPPLQTTAKAIGCKQSIKGSLLGLAHKYVKLVNYDDLNDSDILMKIFKEWIHTHEEGQCNKQTIEQNNQVIKSDQDTETTQLDIQNPLKHIGKGCPPKRQIKSAIEQSKKSKHSADTSSCASCQCSICKSKEYDK